MHIVELEVDFHGILMTAVLESSEDWEYSGDIPPSLAAGEIDLVKLYAVDGNDQEVSAMWMLDYQGGHDAITKFIDKLIWEHHNHTFFSWAESCNED
jgi:hypothetical protein